MSGARVLLVGSGGREHAIGSALRRSEAEIMVAAPSVNPGLRRIAKDYGNFRVEDGEAIAAWAKQRGASLAIVGPDAAIGAGVADSLRSNGIPTVGPGARAGMLEGSKAYAREFLEKHGIKESPTYRIVRAEADLDPAVAAMEGREFVVKPSWLTSGKGVMVGGVDFPLAEDGKAIARKLLSEGKGEPIVIEERLEGEEFSLMAFVDGQRVYPLPAVQDYKRAQDGDKGGNTGGMGAYSTRDGLLPFLTRGDYEYGVWTLEKTVSALRDEGIDYRGILYGGFMLTAKGPRVLEFNARFGDPECLNLLTIYDGTDFADLMMDIASGSMNTSHLAFRKRATVSKYIVPPGYGSSPRSGGTLEVDEGAILRTGATLYYGSVVPGDGPGKVIMGTSRALAIVGEGSALKDALARVDDCLRFVKGECSMRHDIATAIDLKKRVDHMQAIRSGQGGVSPGMANPTRSGPNPPSVFT